MASFECLLPYVDPGSYWRPGSPAPHIGNAIQKNMHAHTRKKRERHEKQSHTRQPSVAKETTPPLHASSPFIHLASTLCLSHDTNEKGGGGGEYLWSIKCFIDDTNTHSCILFPLAQTLFLCLWNTSCFAHKHIDTILVPVDVLTV